MILLKKTADLRKWLDAQQQKGKLIGFCPTMGALHDGHISLIKQSKTVNQVTLSSIFINPTQFNDPADFEKYPVTIEKDIRLLEAAGCDVLFLPTVKEIYPMGLQSTMHYELGYLETILEGKFRPGHFQGVCTVVHRLLDIVQPDNLYLGQKDFQQCMVIKKLLTLVGMQDKVSLTICPTLRETDGLAMSSRNMRLNPEERKTATAIYQSLILIRDTLNQFDFEIVKAAATDLLEKNGFRVDYVEIASADDLTLLHEPLQTGNDKNHKWVALVAAYLHEVRLIDNLLLN